MSSSDERAPDGPSSVRWRSRPWAALAVRLLIVLAPLVLSLIAAWAAGLALPVPSGWVATASWWAVIIVVALVTLFAVDVAVRRLLPLAALLELTMLFPDRAPSRFAVARAAAGSRGVRRQLLAARAAGAEEPERVAGSVLALVTALGTHDKRTRGHSERVHVFADAIAEEMGFEREDRDRLRWAALLHDIGKLDVDAELLNKPGRPDLDEWEMIRRHPQEGERIVAPLLPFLGHWGSAIGQHHERWDGGGYPRGLAGGHIGISARIVAVADAFEVMTAPRTYKRPVGPEAARQELARCAGSQFDPEVVRALLGLSLAKIRRALGPVAVLSAVPLVGRAAAAGPAATKTVASAAVAGALAVGGVAPDMTSPQPPPPEVTVAEAVVDQGALEDGAGDAVGQGLAGVGSAALADSWATAPQRASAVDASGAWKAPRTGRDEAVETSDESTGVLPRAGTTNGDATGSRWGRRASDSRSDDSSGDAALGDRRPDDPAGHPAPDDPAPEGPGPSTGDAPPARTASGESPAADAALEATRAPYGHDDHAAARPGRAVNIDVLANDEHIRGGPHLRVIVEPQAGVASVESDGTITYRPRPRARGEDRFRYQVCVPHQGCGTAWVTVRITRT